ncbi:MAG: hypothetical protein M3220_00260, partial [Chloroflexota bacterium]|nr:hypothetical protein [Chloroflexota bacterium]
MRKLLLWLSPLVIVLIVAVASMDLSVLAATSPGGTESARQEEQVPALQGETLGTVAALEGTLQEVYQEVNPAVVSIQVVGTAQGFQ